LIVEGKVRLYFSALLEKSNTILRLGSPASFRFHLHRGAGDKNCLQRGP
jgi:hypothetical protein